MNLGQTNYGLSSFPTGKDFAFTIFDDTDGSTIENVKPLYDYLSELGLRTTKSVWVLPSEEPNSTGISAQTLNDPEYLAFILELKRKGFEIAFHGPRDGSTKRPEIQSALEAFKEMIGHCPYTYANHSRNRENLYWGAERLDIQTLRLLYSLAKKSERDRFSGHIKNSDYFWGDLAQEHLTYIRNFTFRDINTLKINPAMPYHDPKRPHVNFWFSSSDGHDVNAFNRLLSKRNIDRLEREHGVCIVYTHFASGFVSGGKINKTTQECLRDLASRNGYFTPARDILDHLRQLHGQNHNIGWKELSTMQARWCMEKLIYKNP